MIVVGCFGWIRDADSGGFDGEKKEGVEVGGISSGGGSAKKSGYECCTDGSLYGGEVFGHIRHYALQVLSLVLVCALSTGLYF